MAKYIQKQKQDIRQLATQKRQKAKKFDTDDLKSALLNVFRGFVSETVSVVLKTDQRRLIGAAYSADESEIDPFPIVTFLHNEGWQTALPRIEKDVSLSFRVWQPGDDLVIGKFDMQEPAPESSIVAPDLVITPLLAFDNYGNRLGRGGGYYDRALKTLRAQGKVLVVGIAFETQLFDLSPHDEHDEKLDFVLTPSGVHHFEAVK
ncbi:MAG: 5-formyltetrahydrofolate cyclo-ligase [Pseudomonadota bacterium]|nr:5-formyltetrahydrofolate cyclo-ligase [Pseudomonadota bacterium]